MSEEQPIIIKKIIKVSGGGHGGAWKVAYADFVTAMMAFFLLLWLLNVTTDEQKHGIAEYFAPTTTSRSQSGSGGILGGQTLSPEGARVGATTPPSVVVELSPPKVRKLGEDSSKGGATEEEEAEELRKRAEAEQALFEDAKSEIEQVMDQTLELNDMKRNVIIDYTPEGLRIQLVDSEGRSLFQSGSAEMNDHTRKLLNAIAEVIGKLPNQLAIAGHTDAVPFNGRDGYGNWELSSDRAHSTRRALSGFGIETGRFSKVSGRADTEPLVPEDPTQATNRRVAITLLREIPVIPRSERKL